MVKAFKNHLNQKSYGLETWHAVSRTQALLSLNDDPGLTVTYFMTRSNLVAFVFEWGHL